MKSINPNYITFLQAKLLKEKGFNYHEIFQDFANHYDYNVEGEYHRRHESDFDLNDYPNEDWIPVAEQWQVTEWLLQKHHLFIYPKILSAFGIYAIDNDFNCEYLYEIIDIKLKEPLNLDIDAMVELKLKTPQESYSAAFDYILKNII
jgi:hypothetical protein